MFVWFFDTIMCKKRVIHDSQCLCPFAGYSMAGIVLDGEMGTEEGSDLPVLMRREGDGDDGDPICLVLVLEKTRSLASVNIPP